ncbi:MAG: D-arabinono-1,4-lactone oxidase [Solirubrobacterales bacterium]
MEPSSWSNWFGNVTCHPRLCIHPADEGELADTIVAAGRAGDRVAIAGAGHSNVPLVATDGTLLDLDRMAGIASVDLEQMTATVGAGTVIAELGDALWDLGLGLINQGDIDAQRIAGAVATGTHGTGRELTSFSGAVVGGRLITADGSLRRFGPADPDLLDAARTSLGVLGAISELTLSVREAYCVERTWLSLRWGEFEERWHELLHTNRHCTFFWLPQEDSSAGFGIPPGEPDSILVKMMNPRPKDAPPSGSGDHSDPTPYIDRSYRVFPDEYGPDFAELEYFIAQSDCLGAMAEVRELIRGHHPDQRYPVEVRFTAADPGWLSPAYERDSCVVSCGGSFREDYEPFLRDCDRILARFDGRPHWGKLGFAPEERLERLLPRLPDFRDLRRRLDPAGVFLGDWLKSLLA